jgi:hypothetical protein
MRRSFNLQSFQGLEPEHIPDDGRQDIRHRTFLEQVEWVRYISNLVAIVYEISSSVAWLISPSVQTVVHVPVDDSAAERSLGTQRIP